MIQQVQRTKEDTLRRIREKYPAYQNVDDETLASAIYAKYGDAYPELAPTTTPQSPPSVSRETSPPASSKSKGVLTPKEAGSLLGKAFGVTEEEKRSYAAGLDARKMAENMRTVSEFARTIPMQAAADRAAKQAAILENSRMIQAKADREEARKRGELRPLASALKDVPSYVKNTRPSSTGVSLHDEYRRILTLLADEKGTVDEGQEKLAFQMASALWYGQATNDKEAMDVALKGAQTDAQVVRAATIASAAALGAGLPAVFGAAPLAIGTGAIIGSGATGGPGAELTEAWIQDRKPTLSGAIEKTKQFETAGMVLGEHGAGTLQTILADILIGGGVSVAAAKGFTAAQRAIVKSHLERQIGKGLSDAQFKAVFDDFVKGAEGARRPATAPMPESPQVVLPKARPTAKPSTPETPPAGTGAKGTAEPPAIPSAQELGKTGRRAQANAHAPYVVQAAEDLKRRLDAAGIEYSENWGSRPGKQGTHGRTSVYIKVGDRTVRISDHISTSQRNMSRIYQIVPNKGTVTDAEAFLLGKGAAEPPTPPVKDQAGRRTTITDDGLISDARVPHTREVLEGTRPLTPKEFAERVDAYEKIARAEGVPIFKGVESRSFAGAFVTGEKAYRQGRIKMTDLGLESYASTLSHELAHAIDARITTSAVAAAAPKISKEAGRVRLPKGDLTLLLDVDAATAKAMDKSLREVTWALISKKVIGRADLTIGKALARENPSYYHRKNELWARFLESVAFHPEIVARYAPEALDKLIAKAASDPVLGDFIAVAMGKGIERGQGIRLLPDRRQLFIKQYGKYLGTKAYDAEVVALRRMQQQVDELTSLIKQKFKGVKDDPSTIFKAAEAIQSNNQGVKVFGTADRTFIPLKDIGIDPASLGKADSIPPSVIEALADWDAAGWKIDGISEAGEIILRRTRYTAEEGKTLYDSLSPQGKKLIDEFTATVSEARDLFNRHLFASTYNIKESIEGWVHHFWREKLRAEVAPGRLRERMASLRKRREGALGFAEDLKAATTKAYTEEAATQIWNEFVNKQIARLAEPLPKGSRRARHGYVTVQGNPEKGFRLYEGDIKKGNLWEVPKWVYEDYVQRRLISAEASQATQVVNAINQYWQVNALLHPGSVVLNAISGALQLVPRLLDDFFLDMFELSAKRTTANVVGLVETLTPRGWHGAPDWVIGGRHNTFVGQFQAAKSPIDKFADKGLYPFGVIERYFKKAIANAERRKFKAKDFEDPALIKAANDAIDIVAYDYNNIPHWLQNLKRHPVGAAAKPFATYPYKYTKQLFEFVGKAFDPNVPIRDRVARLFTIATMTTMYLLWEEWEKNASQYGKLSAEEKEEMGLTARHYVGKDSAGEAWLRTGQYPFVNAFDAVNLVAAGRPDLAGEMAGEIVAGVGPLGNTGMALFGYSSKYDRYQPMAGRVGESAQTYVPGFRLLRDIAELRDAGTRKQPTTFWEAFGRLYPTGDPELREQLAGERQIKGRLRDPQSYQEWLRLLSGVNIRNPKDNSKKPAVKKPAKK